MKNTSTHAVLISHSGHCIKLSEEAGHKSKREKMSSTVTRLLSKLFCELFLFHNRRSGSRTKTSSSDIKVQVSVLFIDSSSKQNLSELSIDISNNYLADQRTDQPALLLTSSVINVSSRLLMSPPDSGSRDTQAFNAQVT